MPVILSRKGGGSGGGGGAPSGPAGGDLAGTYPNPTFAVDMATQAELDAVSTVASAALPGDILFDSTLGGDAAAIDTGAAGVAGGHNLLEIFILARTTQAAELSSVNITFNNDGGANYDRQHVSGGDSTASAAASLAQTAINANCTGASAQAGAAALITMVIPGYTQTTFHKVSSTTVCVPEDTAGSNRVRQESNRWRSTAAITRVAVTSSSGNLLAGSRLLIYGR